MNGAKRERRKEDEKKNPARDCAITPDAHVRSSRGRERGAGSVELRARSVELRAKGIEQRAKGKELRARSTERGGRSREHGAKSKEHRAKGKERGAKSMEHRANCLAQNTWRVKHRLGSQDFSVRLNDESILLCSSSSANNG